MSLPFKYSLIIPHYNIPNLLRRLLSTVPRREDLQVIVVDDCSTENLRELENLKKDYNWIEWYSTVTNGGGGKARNIGLQHAKGEYILFADSDDFFLPNFNDILNEFKNISDFDIIFFNYISLYSDTLKLSARGGNWQFKKFLIGNQKKFESYMKFLYGEPWGKFIKHELISKNNIKFDETPIHNDTLFSYMVGYHAKTIKIDTKTLYCITQRPYSVSQIINPENLKVRAEIFSKKNNFFMENNINEFDEILFKAFDDCKNDQQLTKELYEICNKNGISKNKIKKEKRKMMQKRIFRKLKQIYNHPLILLGKQYYNEI